MTIPVERRPSTARQDSAVYRLWRGGHTPKVIMQALTLTRDQVYDGLARHRAHLAKIRQKPTARAKKSK